MRKSLTSKSFSSRFDVSVALQKIIIVEDNHIIAQSTKKIFQNVIEENNLDYEVTICDDGIDMIRTYLNEEFNCLLNLKMIITDENMEYMNGSEAIRFVREIEKRKKLIKVKIISLSSNEDINVTDNIFRAGADNVVQKPLTRQSILNLLKENGLMK